MTAGPSPSRLGFRAPERPPRGVALIAHGRNGAPDQPQIAPMADACLARGLAILAPDLSPPRSARFSMDGHLAAVAEALDAAADHAASVGGPLVLLGHSMGAYAVCRLAAELPENAVAGIVAASPVVSGAALLAARARMGPEALAALRAELPDAERDWPAHDLAPFADRLTMPVAVIVGADDAVTPPEDAAGFAASLPGDATCEILPGEHHCPVGSAYAACLARALERFGA